MLICALRAAGVAALAAVLLACSPTFDWREVAVAPSSAALLLPCKPERTMRMVALGGEPTELSVVGCDTGGATFAIMTAKVAASRAPDPLLEGWQQATLANMQADMESVQRRDFLPPGGLPLPHAQRLLAQGHRASGKAVEAQAVWTARVNGAGESELLHAVVYASRPQQDAVNAFFASIRWR